MKTTLLFATQNPNKVKEVSDILNATYQIITPNQLGFSEVIEETGTTLIANSLLKVNALERLYEGNIFAEDTGLEVAILKGEPGIYTARFAGPNASDTQNMNKLLLALEATANRDAQFRTVICLKFNQEYHYFEGLCKGTIAKEKRGEGGFGYDPIFIPNGYEKTFSELGSIVKKTLSHRAMAMEKLINFLKN